VWAIVRLSANYSDLETHRVWTFVFTGVVVVASGTLFVGSSRKPARSPVTIMCVVIVILAGFAAAPTGSGADAYPQSPQLQFLGDASALVFALLIVPVTSALRRRRRESPMGQLRGSGTRWNELLRGCHLPPGRFPLHQPELAERSQTRSHPSVNLPASQTRTLIVQARRKPPPREELRRSVHQSPSSSM
jgi:hypothetical protein